MQTTKPPPGGAGQSPDATAYYEITGTRILSAHARTEMRKTVARLKRDLRTAFSGEPTERRDRGSSGHD